MWDFNSNIPLNTVTNLLLAALIAALFFVCINDREIMHRKSFNYYINWLIMFFSYLIADTAFYLSVMLEFDGTLRDIINCRYVFTSFVCAIPALSWAVALIAEKKQPPMRLYRFLTALLLIIPSALIAATFYFKIDYVNAFLGNSDYLPSPVFYIALYILIAAVFIYVFMHRRDIGSTESVALMLFMVSTALFDIQSYWQDIPGNIFSTALMFAIYIDVWQKRKNELITQNMRIAQQQKQLAEKELELTNARVTLMMSQIQPHFLYNTLSSISFLCTKDPKKARQVTNDFVVYLRGNLDALSSQKLIPFSEELEHIKTYLKIEKVRFDDTLNVEFDIRVTDFSVPALSIQPLVENAVKYGVCKKLGGGTVCIKSRDCGSAWVITITDNGSGFDISKINWIDGTHHGIENSRKRLEYQCGGIVNIDSTIGVGTTVTVKVPKEAKS